MSAGKPDCQVTVGNEAYITPGSTQCIYALIALNIFDVPSGGGRFYIPREIPTDVDGINNKFADLSNACARCPVLAQAFPNVPKALGA